VSNLSEAGRTAIQESNRDRAQKCGKCGNLAIDIRDGSKVGGMPGLNYKVCGNCGWSSPITQRPRREKLREVR
jgi:hypothetical protein